MLNRLGSLLGVFEDERRVFFPLFLVFMALFLGAAVFRNYADAAFIKRYGVEQIPLMLAAATALTYALYPLMRRFAQAGRDSLMLGGFLLAYALAGGLLLPGIARGGVTAYPVIYILLQLQDTVFLVCMWNMASRALSPRQGKRLFPMLLAGQTAGAVCGYFASPFMAEFWGEDSLLIFSLAVYTVLGAILLLRTRKAAPAKASPQTPDSPSLRRAAGLMRQYPILRFLLVSCLLSGLLLPMFTYEFGLAVNNGFGTEKGLIEFLGYLRGGASALIFVLLLCAGRMYARMNLSLASSILPLNMLLVFGGFAIFFNVAAAAYAQVSQLLLMRAVTGPANKVLFNLLPENISKWSQTLARSSLARTSLLAGSLLTMGLQTFLSGRQTAIAGMILALYWLGEALVFMRNYRGGIRRTLLLDSMDFDAASESWAGKDISAGQGPSLDDYPEEIIDLLEERDLPDIDSDQALAMLDSSSAEDRAKGAAWLGFSPDPRSMSRLTALLEDEERVKNAAQESLVKYAARYPEALTMFLHTAPHRSARGLLEAARLSGRKDFNLRPLIRSWIGEGYGALAAVASLRELDRPPVGDLLHEGLRRKLEDMLDLAFQALWVEHSDMRLAAMSLRSSSPALAVELVEATLSKDLKRVLLPLVDEIPLMERISRGKSAYPGCEPESADAALARLLLSPDPLLRMLAAACIGHDRPLEKHLPLLHGLRADSDPQAREAAEYALKRCRKGEEAMPMIINHVRDLAGFSIFKGVGVRELRAIATVVQSSRFEPGEVLVAQDDPGPDLVLITQGKALLRRENETAGEKELGPGDFFGETSLFTKKPAAFSCVALEKTMALRIGQLQFIEIMKLYPSISFNLCRFFAQKVEELPAEAEG